MERIHHLTFVVFDLEQAVARFTRDFGARECLREPLPERGVLTARFLVGGSWFVLVQPVGEGTPASRLREQGEGLLLVSFQVRDLETTLAEFESRGVMPLGGSRSGVAGWLVQDLKSSAIPGTTLQLCIDSN